MAFSDLTFLFQFLPLFLLIYYLTPGKYRNWTLLAGSIIFYYIGVRQHPWMLIPLFAMSVLCWLAAILLANMVGSGRKIAFITTLVLLFGCLLSFKYTGLFSDYNLLLPLGISFYTFQNAAYIIDVYRRNAAPERSPLRYLSTVIFFPKLLSGPLTDYNNFNRQIKRRHYSLRNFDLGLRDFIIGLGLKVLLANQIGGLWSQIEIIGFSSISAPLAWMGLISYSLKIYFDFQGYSLLAIGLGKMLGFDLPENFRHPYASRSMTDFWRRWHITLGRWFRDYLYIPLGGSRQGQKTMVRNLLIVWLVTGIWHGATINFLLWGLFLFALITAEKLWFKPWLERHHFLAHVYMVPAILLSWMLFAIPELADIGIYLSQLFTGFDFAANVTPDFIRYGQQYGLLLIIGIIFATPLPAKIWSKMRQAPFGTIILLIIFWFCIYCLAAGYNDPFMYFSF